jgi:WD40 repeat protein
MTQRHLLSPLFLFVCFSLLIAVPARAQGEIIYSARYYYPPGDKRASSFHLYRINPDGTGRKQITTGALDDVRPVWSPDGGAVLFEREIRQDTTRASLCLVGANGGPVTTLIPDLSKVGVDKKVWLPDGRRIVLLRIDYDRMADAGSVEIWDTRTRKRTARYEACDTFTLSPDGKTLFLDKTGSGVFVDLATGKTTSVPMTFSPSVWADNDTLASLELAAEGEQESSFFGTKHVVLAGRDGKEKRRFTPQRSPELTAGEDDGPVSVLQAAPGSAAAPGTIALFSEHRNIYWFGIMRLTDGTLIAEQGGFTRPVWSPDGKRFVTVASANLTAYGKTGKRLFTASLCVGTNPAQKPKAIVSGLVWVVSADWRGSRQ